MLLCGKEFENFQRLVMERLLRGLIPIVLAVAISPVIYSCNLDDFAITNLDPGYTLVYSSSSTYNVQCGSNSTAAGSLDYIDLRNSDSVNIRFRYSLTNNLVSHFVIYYNDGFTERILADFRYASTSGTSVQNVYIRNVNLNQIFNYRISIISNDNTCEFKVSDLRIYKKLNN